jgi:hypothetical protein
VATSEHASREAPSLAILRDARWRAWPATMLACAAIAALSLLLTREPTYDPWAWIVWGREIAHGTLSTVGGPSWKPLPVLFTTPFALLGNAVAPTLWVFVARFAGLMSIAVAYRVAARIAGAAAGGVAALALLLADQYVRNFARGNSEGVLVALGLGAIERHLAGRRVTAFCLIAAAGLLRPEVWPFLAAYGLWVLWDGWQAERRLPWAAGALVAGAGIVVLAAWFVPERLGSGTFTRSASRALEAVTGSPAQQAHPFVAVFSHSAAVLSPPVYAAGVLAVVLAVRLRARTTLAVALVSGVLMLLVGVLAEIGFTGNPRYVTLAAALVCVLAGVGVTWGVELARRLPGRRGTALLAAAAVVTAGFAAWRVSDVATQMGQVRDEARLYAALPDVIAAAGGREAVTACGPVYTGAFQTQALAWWLHVRQRDVSIHPAPPGVIVAPVVPALEGQDEFPDVLATQQGWTVRASCSP